MFFMKIKNKRGMQLAISTVILLVIGIILLIGVIAIVVMGWDDFKTAIGAALGGELSQAKRNCVIACAAKNSETYCAKVTIDGEDIDCTNAKLVPKNCPSTGCPNPDF